MAMNLSKTQIDRLGDRLKKGDITEDDLRLLDTYRRSFADAYDEVVGAVRKELGLEPTGRPAKSTTSISEKLRRESIRLTQIQDIAGCRLIVPDIANQDQVVQSLSRLFENTNIVDRRQKPSHGYRAVHVIVTHLGKVVEIQVRTALQHLWAEFSEKLSDRIGLAIKYGAGNDKIRETLLSLSNTVAARESNEIGLNNLLSRSSSDNDVPDVFKQDLALLQEEFNMEKENLLKFFQDIISDVARLRGDRDDISD
jgi:ppGpp synthetase/RelA/SpoT-type nucleotidyltranferase